MITGTDKNPSFGLAADGKPENVPNGHLHVEIDTFKASLYDEENNTWYEDESGGGGGGSGGVLAVTFGGVSGAVPDKTTEEIAAAASAGQLVVFNWTTEYGKCSALASVTVSSGTMTGAAASAIQPGMLNAEASSIKYQNGSWTLKEAYLPYPDV